MGTFGVGFGNVGHVRGGIGGTGGGLANNCAMVGGAGGGGVSTDAATVSAGFGEVGAFVGGGAADVVVVVECVSGVETMVGGVPHAPTKLHANIVTTNAARRRCRFRATGG